MKTDINSPRDVKLCLKKRDPESHKGDHGRVLVIGGSKDYVGAPFFAGMAAIRAGCDIAVVAAPEKVAWAINTLSPDIITKKFDGEHFESHHVKDIVKLSEQFDAVVIGNGIGINENTQSFIRQILTRIDKPKIIDADAIKALKGIKVTNTLMTPHIGEFKSFCGIDLTGLNTDDKAKIVKEHSSKECIILLKGHTDIISDGNRIKLNRTGNPGMTVGGTGDVLAGMCASFVANKNDLFDSAIAAAYINGQIGDVLEEKIGYGFTASDMLFEIPKAIKSHLKER